MRSSDWLAHRHQTSQPVVQRLYRCSILLEIHFESTHVENVRGYELENSCDKEADLVIEPVVMKRLLQQRVDPVDREKQRRLLPDPFQGLLGLLESPSVDRWGEGQGDPFLGIKGRNRDKQPTTNTRPSIEPKAQVWTTTSAKMSSHEHRMTTT